MLLGTLICSIFPQTKLNQFLQVTCLTEAYHSWSCSGSSFCLLFGTLTSSSKSAGQIEPEIPVAASPACFSQVYHISFALYYCSPLLNWESHAFYQQLSPHALPLVKIYIHLQPDLTVPANLLKMRHLSDVVLFLPNCIKLQQPLVCSFWQPICIFYQFITVLPPPGHPQRLYFICKFRNVILHACV